MQFAGLLVMISVAFLILTWPYYIAWICFKLLTPSSSTTGDPSSMFPTQLSQLNDSQLKYSLEEMDSSDTLLAPSSSSLAGQGPSGKKFVLQITRMLFYAQFAINFPLYSITSRIFRTEMKRMFTMRSMRRKARILYENGADDGFGVSEVAPRGRIDCGLKRIDTMRRASALPLGARNGQVGILEDAYQ